MERSAIDKIHILKRVAQKAVMLEESPFETAP
jgi:hypothetical protein